MRNFKIPLVRFTGILLLCAACATMDPLAARDASISSVPRFAAGHVQIPAVSLPSTSDRWAGYALTGSAYTSMQGSWTVPTVTYAPGGSAPGTQQVSSTWIGLGGNGTGDNTLVQLGTLQSVGPGGGTQYYAWYLFYGGLGQGVTPLDSAAYPVQPGDTITATISCTANCASNAVQTWQLTMNSTRWANPWRSPLVQYQDSLASAEWIIEAATVGGTISNMPNFTPVQFSNNAVNGSIPNFTSSQAIALVTASGAPIAEVTQKGASAFTVQRIGLPVIGSLPTGFVPNKCPPATMLGEMTQPPMNFQGSLSPGQVVYGLFYVTKYSQINTGAPPFKTRSYAIDIIDDLTGISKLSDYSQDLSIFFLTVDPGFYCVRIRPLAGGTIAYNFQLAAGPAGWITTPNPNAPQNLTLMDLGNLSSNLYYGTRYVWAQTHPGDANTPPVTLAPGHDYELRDWVGVAAPNQWYWFTLDAPRNLKVSFTGLYMGATVSLVDWAGNFVGATVYSNSSPLGSIIASQSYTGQLPAGNYKMHIAFTGVGSPGTRFTLEVTAQ